MVMNIPIFIWKHSLMGSNKHVFHSIVCHSILWRRFFEKGYMRFSELIKLVLMKMRTDYMDLLCVMRMVYNDRQCSDFFFFYKVNKSLFTLFITTSGIQSPDFPSCGTLVFYRWVISNIHKFCRLSYCCCFNLEMLSNCSYLLYICYLLHIYCRMVPGRDRLCLG